MSGARAPESRDQPRHPHRNHPQGGGGGGGERRTSRGKRPSGSSASGSLGRGALSDPDLQSRLQPNLNAFWVRNAWIDVRFVSALIVKIV
ncbi:hypothetical protein O3G_MSEX001676 [Manduca sexta]|uniref:Uncharacterized protein n=1 Tax=Manduca sexta TaxID=7130 RepID=A0A921YL26_MANSE|nr:hypothetical protein O3G_MSEX001676 [Manduca sexta]